MSKLRSEHILAVRFLYSRGATKTEIARLFNIHRSTVAYWVDTEYRESKNDQNRVYWRERYGTDVTFTKRHRRRAREAQRERRVAVGTQ